MSHAPGGPPLLSLELGYRIVTVFVGKCQGLIQHNIYPCFIKIRLLPIVSQNREERRKGDRRGREREKLHYGFYFYYYLFCIWFLNMTIPSPVLYSFSTVMGRMVCQV